MQVNKNNVSQFLTANNTTFVIPVYQRNYDWTEENCKQLWNDIWYVSQSDNRQTHFLGTICSKTLNSHEKTIIDGQQRITTLTLMMKAMHDYVQDKEFKEDIKGTYLQNMGYGVTPNHKVKLHLNRRDDTIYNKLLESDDFMAADELEPKQADSSVYKNYVFFYQKCFNGLTEQQIVDVRSALDRMVIVDLDVEAENPQEIFESLNSTGLDLSDVDLLRNFLLMSLEYETQVKLYDNYWYKIEQNVNPKNMVRFFVDYLIYTKKSDSITIRGRRGHINERNLYIAFKDYYCSLAGEKDRYCSVPDVTEQILKQMYECSKTYKKLVYGGDVDMNNLAALDQAIYSIIYINEAVGARPVLLYILTRLEIDEITEDEALEMVNACLALVFRAKVIGATGINGQFAGNVIQKLPEGKETGLVEKFWKALTSGNGKFTFPSDESFREALLTRQIFDVLRSKWTKYMFYALEQRTRVAKGLPRYDDVNISIEHIMPKTLTADWKNYLGEDAEQHDEYLNRLGNLTLTSNNSEMSNSPFEEKKDWFKESSFSYTKELVSRDSWSIEQIRQRGEELAEKCLEAWPMPAAYQPAKAATVSKRRPPFRFSMIDLVEGDEVAFYDDPSKVATVADDNHVLYNDKKYSLSALAGVFLNKDGSFGVAGPEYFTYEGEKLNDIRTEREAGAY